MEHQCSPLLSWAYCSQQGKMQSMEELKQALVHTTLELEQTKAAVQQELKKRDQQLLNLKELVNKAMKERDEAQDKCQRLLLENLLIQQQQQKQATSAPISGIDSSNNNNNNGGQFCSSDCEESIVSSPQLTEHSINIELMMVADKKPLPEKGKLLQAVMKAGPLLQTLLLAGPLPQWRHPPPPLDSFQIPPVTIPSPPQPQPQHQLASFAKGGRVSGKRAFCDASASASESPTETKYQRVLLH